MDSISFIKSFPNYLLHPLDSELSPPQRLLALITTIAIGIFTCGIFHLVYLLWNDRRHVSTNSPSLPNIEAAPSQASTLPCIHPTNSIALATLTSEPSIQPQISSKAFFKTFLHNTIDKAQHSLTRASLRLDLIHGNLTTCYQPTSGVCAFVSAANNQLEWGGTGTNHAFSKWLSKAKWNEEKLKSGKLKLRPTETVTWGLPSKEDYPKCKLIQVLGPVVNNNSDLEQSACQVYQAYKNVFKACREQKIPYVQLCLLSNGPYAPSSPDKRAEWLAKVNEELATAIHEEFLLPNGIKHIAVVDRDNIPITQILEVDDNPKLQVVDDNTGFQLTEP